MVYILDGESEIVISGSPLAVKEGEMVIVEGHFTLAHDARVQVAK
jgi:uncharacterized cupin superfamily protein